jgi:DNA-binding transcriptional LysR family regulator
MDFRHLIYFVTLAEELHFRRAAERLHVVQPALSQQIARLEAELGVQLFARTKRQVQLTAAGRVFLGDARGMLTYRDQAVEAAQRAAKGHEGRLNLGFVGPAAYNVLPPLVRAYRAKYPDVLLNLHEHTTAEQLKMLAADELCVGIVRMPVYDSRFEVERILTESIAVALPADHPLSAAETVHIADLAGDGFILVPRALEPVVFDRYVTLCLSAGFSPTVVQEALQIHAIIGMVATGLGVALVPESMSTLRRFDVVYRPLETPADAALDTGVAWRAGETPPVVDRFIETVRAWRSKHPVRPDQA